ncbi:MAG: ChuX/HutX family heme-like substrate-binding protein [Steroidobacteraceae bacterium]
MPQVRNARSLTTALGLACALLGTAGTPARSEEAAAAPAAACPGTADVQRVAAAYGNGPAPMPFAVAPQLKLPESTIAAAMPAGMSVGVDGTLFPAVWDSLAAWQDEALIMVMKGGNVFEIHAKIPKGEPSTKSKFFNLGQGHFTGHLRPDLISAIHGVQLQGREGTVRGFFFYDAQGASVFGVFIGGEAGQANANQVADFEKTWNLLKSLPQRCATK